MYKDQAKKSVGDSQGIGIGEVLLLLSLTMDGLTGAVQVILLQMISIYATGLYCCAYVKDGKV